MGVNIQLWNWTSSYVPRNNSTPTNDVQINTNSSSEIYRTLSVKKYHLGSCRYLSKSKIPITLNEAQEKGLGPCGVCKPTVE